MAGDGATGSTGSSPNSIHKYYNPLNIFEGGDKTIDDSSNAELTTSFYHSRTGNHPGKECTESRHHYKFYNNAGAAQLYKQTKDGKCEIYYIQGKEKKEYHSISFNNNLGFNAYSHVERLLMRDILDDLIPHNNEGLKRPSDYPEKTEYDILKNLANKDVQLEYKRYLEKEKLIVKMWSERPPCTRKVLRVQQKDIIVEGGTCLNFINNIFPEGSQYGHISTDEQEHNVQKAWADFKTAYSAYRDA